MPAAIIRTIRERGFRKWYERELIRGHLHLVLLLCCTLAALGAVEALGELRSVGHAGDLAGWQMAACLVVAAGVGAWSMRRYLFHLNRAEFMANQAVCPSCQTYARWSVLRGDAAPSPEAGGELEVCCRHCGHRWHLNL